MLFLCFVVHVGSEAYFWSFNKYQKVLLTNIEDLVPCFIPTRRPKLCLWSILDRLLWLPPPLLVSLYHCPFLWRQILKKVINRKLKVAPALHLKIKYSIQRLIFYIFLIVTHNRRNLIYWEKRSGWVNFTVRIACHSL